MLVFVLACHFLATWFAGLTNVSAKAFVDETESTAPRASAPRIAIRGALRLC